MKDAIVKGIGLIVTGLLMIVVYAVLVAWFLKILWNGLLPTLFSLPTITFWQACGLLLLSGILFRTGATQDKD